MDIKTTYNHALLAEAAYADLWDETTNKAITNGTKVKLALESVDKPLSKTQIEEFLKDWEVISHQANTASGFSATLFKNKHTQEYVFANRGTEGDVLGDIISADILGISLGGIANFQAIDMYRYFKKLSTPAGDSVNYSTLETEMIIGMNNWTILPGSVSASDTSLRRGLANDIGIGALVNVDKVSTAGHSLGGHLSSLLSVFFSGTVNNLSTYNGAGLGGAIYEVIDKIQALFGGDMLSILKNTGFHNYAEVGKEMTAGVGVSVGTPTPIFVEAQTLDVMNHSVILLVDSLAVSHTLWLLDPKLTQEVINSYLEMGAIKPEESLERIVNAIGNLLNVGSSVSIDNREALHARIALISDELLVQPHVANPQLKPEYQGLSIVNINTISNAVGGDSQEGLAYRYALVNLNPFAVTGSDSLYSKHSDLAVENFSEQYLQDRVQLLTYLNIQRTTDNSATLIGAELSTYQDIDSDTLVHVAGTSHAASISKQYLFGSSEADTLSGLDNDDHLYGGADNDTLKGKAGNDYLEGGKGADRLEGGSDFDTYFADDSDVISDSDHKGAVKLNNEVLTGGIRTNGDPANTYTSVDGKFTYVLSGSKLTVNGGLVIENYDKDKHSLNIVLSDIAPVATTTKTISLTSDDDNTQRTEDEGTAADELILGLAGDDVLIGNAGADHIKGGAGNDKLWGGGHDTTFGMADSVNILEGGAGYDHIYGGEGADYMFASSMGDLLAVVQNSTSLETSKDVLSGFGGDDYIIGNSGRNLIHGGAGKDTLYGGAGDDFITGDLEAIGYDDWDMQWTEGHHTIVRGNIIDHSPLLSDDDFIDLGDGNDVGSGGGGNDHILGGLGDDFITGDSISFNYLIKFALDREETPPVFRYGNDFIDAGKGNDKVYGSAGNDIIHGGEGDDYIHGDASAEKDVNGIANLDYEYHGNDVLYGDSGNDTLLGGGGSDILYGGDGDDNLSGGKGVDYLYGGAGTDTLDGGEGVTFSDGGAGRDVFVYKVGAETLTINDVDKWNSIHIVGEVTGIKVTLSNENLSLKINGDSENSILINNMSFRSIDNNSIINSIFYNNERRTISDFLNGIDFVGSEKPDILHYVNVNQSMGLADESSSINTGDSPLLGNVSNDDSALDTGGGTGGGDDYIPGVGPNVPQNGYGLFIARGDRFYGYGGDDIITGGNNRDLIDGGSGSDVMIGGYGDDTYYVDELGDRVIEVEDNSRSSNDHIISSAEMIILSDNVERLTLSDTGVNADGNTSDNYIEGNSLSNTINGVGGSNEIYGKAGDDIIYDGARSSTGSKLYGGSGNDKIYSKQYWSVLYGEEGDDFLDSSYSTGGTIYGGLGNDTLLGGSYMEGGSGNDDYILTYEDTDGSTINNFDENILSLDRLIFENYTYEEIGIKQSSFNVSDLIILRPVSSDYNRIVGTTIENYFTDASYKIDEIIFSDATVWDKDDIERILLENMNGSNADDIIHGMSSDDTIYGLKGDDFLYGSFGNDMLYGNEGVDSLYGNSGDDKLFGGDGNDFLYAGDGDDYLDGGGGDDYLESRTKNGSTTFNGGVGDDLIFVNSDSNHTFLYAVGDGSDEIRFNNPYESSNTLSFSEGITLDNITLYQESYYADRFEIEFNETGDRIKINRFISGDFNVRFSDGNVYDSNQLVNEYAKGYLGTVGHDVINGLSSNDEINGRGGNDYLNGNSGDDIINGGDGEDELHGGEGGDSLFGGNGDDTLYGGYGNDTLAGGRGTDLLLGGAGFDTYYYGIHDENIVIDNRNGVNTQDDSNRLKFKQEIAVGDIALIRNEDDLNIEFEGHTIKIVDYFDLSYNVTTSLEFHDGTIWDYEAVSANLESINSSPIIFEDILVDTIFSNQQSIINVSQILSASSDADDDTLAITSVSSADGVVIYDEQEGNITFTPYDSFYGDGSISYTISDGNGGSAAGLINIHVNQVINGTDEAQQLLGQSVSEKIYGEGGNDVIFAFSGDDELYGGSGDDQLYGGNGSGNNSGNDLLIGGEGNDILRGEDGQDILKGGAGNDHYYYNAGDGVDVIDNAGGGSDWILFNGGIARERLSFLQSGDDLVVRLDDDESQQISVLNHFLGGEYAISYVQPSDGGYAISASDIAGIISSSDSETPTEEGSGTPVEEGTDTGTSETNTDSTGSISGTSFVVNIDGNDVLVGDTTGDVLVAGKGDDTLSGLAGDDRLLGGAGSDVYIIGANSGSDTIIDTEGVNIIRFVDGLGFNDVASGLMSSGDDLILRIGSGGDQVRIENFFAIANTFEKLEFESGGELTAAQLYGAFGRTAPVATALSGEEFFGNGKDNTLIAGVGNDILLAGAGNDTLEGAGGDDQLFGGAGNDTYVIGLNNGKDKMIDTQGVNIIRFIDGITFNDVASRLMSSGDDLILRIGSGGDQIRIENFFTVANTFEKLEFESGGELTAGQLYGAFGATAPTATETITDALSSQNILGDSTDNTLYSGAGDDFLSGGEGSDTYVFNTGFGVDTLDNFDTQPASIDVARFEGVNFEELWLSRNGDHLQIDVAGTDNQVTISNWYGGSDYQLNHIEVGASVLLNNQVDQLVSAMAAYDVPVGAGSVIPQDTKDSLQVVLAESWQVV